MKAEHLLKLMHLLPLQEKYAQTREELTKRFLGEDTAPDSASVRRMQHYLKHLSDKNLYQEDLPPVIKTEGKTPKYYLRETQLTKWLMTEQMALSLLFARQTISRSIGKIDALRLKQLEDEANKLVEQSLSARRIWSKVRIVPDGIGRLPVETNPDVLKVVMEAIMSERQIQFYYHKPSDRPASHPKSTTSRIPERLTSVQGLIAKEGAMYLLCTDGLGDPPKTFRLDRMSCVSVTHHPAQVRMDLNLDRYIESTHQFSFAKNSNLLNLKLRVGPSVISHFIDRPLNKKQVINRLDDDPEGWSLVQAKVPDSILLIPFLLSMGGQLEVLEPAHIRNEIADAAQKMANFYRKDQ